MHAKILEAIFSGHWAMTEQALEAIVDIVSRNEYNKELAFKAFHKEAIIAPVGANRINRSTYQLGNKAIVDIYGVLTPRATMLETESGGATSAETLNQALDAIDSNPSIKEVIFIHDSVGGNIVGINDLAQRISSMKKPTTSFVYGMSASASYWLASSAKRVIASPTAEVGSIGVVASFRKVDESKSGVKKIEIVSSASPLKRVDIESDIGKTVVQDQVDKLAEIFIGTVAKNRNVSVEKVKESFGKGGMLVASDALAVGMIDGISTLNEVLQGNTQTSLQKNATIVAQTPNKEKNKMNAEEIASLTAEDLQAHNPKLAQELAGVGAKKAFEQVTAIEKLALKTASVEGKKIAMEQRFNPEASEGSVALAILNAEEKEREAETERLNKLAEDKRKLADTAGKIQGSNSPATDPDKGAEAVSNMVAGANSAR